MMSATITKRPPDAKCSIIYDYFWDDGRYRATKRRYVPKFFDWCRRQKDGLPPLPGAGDGPFPLYLAHVVAKADPSQTFWLCEGEKDADRLTNLGLVATSCPHGALKGTERWEKWYTRTVRRFDSVIITEDNDAGGREHVSRVGAALSGIIPSVRVLRLPGLAEHGDVSDWLDLGHTLDELLTLADEAPQWTAPEWPDPVPLTDVRGLPDFPTAYIGEWAGDFIDAVHRETLTPQAAPGLLTLCAVSAALARKVAVHVKDNWTEPLNLYTVVVLKSGNLKSPIFKMVCAPIEAWERSEASRLKKSIANAESKHASLKAQLETARKRAGRAKDESERRELEKAAEKLSKQLAEHVVPRAPRLLANDVTEESGGRLLSEHGGRMAIFSDEGGPFRNMAGRWSKNSAAFFELFKHAHNGGRILVDRIGRDPIDVPNAAVALGLMVQPSVLRSLKETPEFRGEGLLARPLYAVPTVPDRDWTTAVGVPFHIAETYHEKMRALLDMPFGSDDRGALAPHVMELSSEALSRVVPFRNEIEARMRSGGDMAHIADWGAKLTGQAIRIATLLHLAELAGQPEPWRKPVPVSAMDRAIAVAREFLIPHALGAFSLIGGGPTSELAEEVLAWIRQHGLTTFTKRDLHRQRRSHVEDPKEWDAPLTLLLTLGWIREVAAEPKKKGRPSEVFEVNPKALPETAPAEHGDAWEGPDDD